MFRPARLAPTFALALGLGCAASPPPPTASVPAREQDQSTSSYRCVVESWSHQELGLAMGRGATPGEASEDAARELCADIDEPCPSEDLILALRAVGGQPVNFGTGVNYRLLRRARANHEGHSETSRALACVDAERVFYATDGPRIRALSGVGGLRWSGVFSGAGVSRTSGLVAALGELPYEQTGQAPFECLIEAATTPVLWEGSLPGREDEQCFAQAPSDVRSGSRRSTVNCDAGGSCETRCSFLGESTTLQVKGVSDDDYRAACVNAARRICPQADCLIELHSVDGLSVDSFRYRFTTTTASGPRRP